MDKIKQKNTVYSMVCAHCIHTHTKTFTFKIIQMILRDHRFGPGLTIISSSDLFLVFLLMTSSNKIPSNLPGNSR